MNLAAQRNVRSSEHAEMQRERILRAAECCFMEHGFHAASMALIATKAGISQGLAYRYFESKDAIILAIIERQLMERREAIQSLQSQAHFVERVVELFESWIHRDNKAMNPVLLLEMSAEASRNPQIASALSRADAANRQEFKRWLARRAQEAGQNVDDQELEKRAIALQLFVEGLALRAVREPDIEPEIILATARLFLPRLLSF